MSMPPPQGGHPNPYGQQGPPPQQYGYPQQQGQAPYPPQQPYGGPQQQHFQGPPQQQYQGPPPQPPRRGGGGVNQTVVKVVAVVLALIIAGVWKFATAGDTVEDAKNAAKNDTSATGADVGECVQRLGTDEEPDIRVVGCSDKNAEFKVADEGITAAGLTCKAGDSKFTITYTRGRSDVALCLTPLNK
ncbi:LppU/SCO3897 family protein [Streptomyces boluensis]|uniref:DUF4333 domain-containing protein n=1 Tax=Streptomyces boluensis TaxID=1775135 RepID=A0A964UZ70_9ACTN|nr:hypothetical protein [Streptomyces boluensis]NBE54225.1 hypothetical protein [Streptomyces boluensis]